MCEVNSELVRYGVVLHARITLYLATPNCPSDCVTLLTVLHCPMGMCVNDAVMPVAASLRGGGGGGGGVAAQPANIKHI